MDPRGIRRQVPLLAALLLWGTAAPGAATWRLTVDGPESTAMADQIRQVDPDRLALALERAGLRLPREVRITLIPETDGRARATAPWIVGQAIGTRDIVIFPERVATYPYDSLESVLRHEVVHLALNDAAAGNEIPRWFHEGVAVSVETGWGLADSVQLHLAALSGPTVADVSRLFRSDALPDTTTAYRLAAALVADVRRRHGAAVPGAIAARVAAGQPFPRAFVIETGETADEAAARAWAGYRRLTAWLPVMTSGGTLWAGILLLAAIAFVAQRRRQARRRQQWDEEEARATWPPPSRR